MLHKNSADFPEIAALEATARIHRSHCHEGEMVWRIWGQGTPLVLMHGGHGSWLHWVHNIPAFSDERMVLAPDLPGHGESALPADELSADHNAEICLAGLREIIGDAPFDTVGFSYGGVIAGHTAALAQSQARHFVMVGTGGLGLTRGDKKDMINWKHMSDPVARVAAHRHNLNVLMLRGEIDELALYIQCTTLPQGRVPAKKIAFDNTLARLLPVMHAQPTAIWGEHDATVGSYMHEREAMLGALPRPVPIHIIEAVGHWVQYEAAEEFNALLREVLAQPGH